MPGRTPTTGRRRWRPVRTTFDGFHYVATTSTIDQNIIGYLAIDADAQPAISEPIEVHATAIAPSNNTTSAASGITLAGCADFTHRRLPARPDHHRHHHRRLTPAMYLDTTSGIQIGLLTVCRRRPPCPACRCSTPPGPTAHLLASRRRSPCQPRRQRPSPTPAVPAGRPRGHHLVTHGMLVPSLRHPRSRQADVNHVQKPSVAAFVVSVAALVAALLVYPVAACGRFRGWRGRSGVGGDRFGWRVVGVGGRADRPVLGVGAGGVGGRAGVGGGDLVVGVGSGPGGGRRGSVGVRGGLVAGGVVHQSGDADDGVSGQRRGLYGRGHVPVGAAELSAAGPRVPADSGTSAFELSYDDGRVDSFDEQRQPRGADGPVREPHGADVAAARRRAVGADVTTVAEAVTAVASATGAVASAVKAADDIDDAVSGKHFLTNDQRSALGTRPNGRRRRRRSRRTRRRRRLGSRSNRRRRHTRRRRLPHHQRTRRAGSCGARRRAVGVRHVPRGRCQVRREFGRTPKTSGPPEDCESGRTTSMPATTMSPTVWWRASPVTPNRSR